MTNNELQILLTLRDKASEEIRRKMNTIKDNLKNFASNFKQNWLAITASITAAIIALKQAFNLAELGAKAKQIENSFSSMAQSVGINAREMKKSIQEASAETTNFSNVASQVSALLAQGLNMQQITALMKQARAEAVIFGTTTEEAFSNISSAITGGLVTTLRRTYGLQLSLEQAVTDYGNATGKTTEEIKKNYMAQALANHVLEAGANHLKAINTETMTQYEQIQKLKAQWTGFKETAGQVLLKIFSIVKGFLTFITSGFAKAASAMSNFASNILGAFEPIAKLHDKLFKTNLAKGLEGWRNALEKQAVGMAGVSEEMANKTFEDWSLAFAKTVEAGAKTSEIIKKQMIEMNEAVNSTVSSPTLEGDKSEGQNALNRTKDFWLQVTKVRQEAQKKNSTLAKAQIMTAKEVSEAQVAFEKNRAEQFENILAMAATKSKEAAIAMKALQLGKAIINTAEGVTQALAYYPPPMSWAMAAVTAAMGAAEIALIASQGFAQGTDSVPASLTPGEIVFPKTMADAIRAGDIVVSGRGGLAGQSSSNNIYINIDSPVVKSEESINDLVEQISDRLAQEIERV